MVWKNYVFTGKMEVSYKGIVHIDLAVIDFFERRTYKTLLFKLPFYFLENYYGDPFLMFIKLAFQS